MRDNSVDDGEKQISARTFYRFVLIGAVASALQYIIMFALIREIQMQAVFASGIGFTISAIANYLLNVRLTFRSKAAHVSTAPRFFATAAAGLGINSVVLFLLASLGLSTVPAQIVTTGVVMLWNYAVNALWTFKIRSTML